ncbi:MAG: hypothetical protein KAU48_09670 [Candidatus Thorarchaeota archaeon]|nr:hypothetical protein [Candidatus Thorarchaeota archaeon]
MSPIETKRGRFVRIANRRTNQVLNELRKLGNCSNTRMYEYTEADVRKIFRTLKKELDRVEKLFSSEDANEFKLE